jgi:hypothetical protein
MLVKTCKLASRVGEIFHAILEGGRTVDGFLTKASHDSPIRQAVIVM